MRKGLVFQFTKTLLESKNGQQNLVNLFAFRYPVEFSSDYKTVAVCVHRLLLMWHSTLQSVESTPSMHIGLGAWLFGVGIRTHTISVRSHHLGHLSIGNEVLMKWSIRNNLNKLLRCMYRNLFTSIYYTYIFKRNSNHEMNRF